MKQLAKLQLLFVSLSCALAVWGFAVPVADACGSYSPLFAEDFVSVAIHDFYAEEKEDTARARRDWLELETIDITDGRVALVSANVRSGEGEVVARRTFALYNLGGTWIVARQPSVALLVSAVKHVLDTSVTPVPTRLQDGAKRTAAHTNAMLHASVGALE